MEEFVTIHSSFPRIVPGGRNFGMVKFHTYKVQRIKALWAYTPLKALEGKSISANSFMDGVKIGKLSAEEQFMLHIHQN